MWMTMYTLEPVRHNGDPAWQQEMCGESECGSPVIISAFLPKTLALAWALSLTWLGIQSEFSIRSCDLTSTNQQRGINQHKHLYYIYYQ